MYIGIAFIVSLISTVLFMLVFSKTKKTGGKL